MTIASKNEIKLLPLFIFLFKIQNKIENKSN